MSNDKSDNGFKDINEAKNDEDKTIVGRKLLKSSSHNNLLKSTGKQQKRGSQDYSYNLGKNGKNPYRMTMNQVLENIAETDAILEQSPFVTIENKEQFDGLKI